jgi:nicotinate-nucleotide pyrophosphorylase (carboxylating)
MPSFGDAERANAATLIDLALREDLGDTGDITSRTTITAEASGAARLVARAPGTLCGGPVLEMIAERFGVRVEARVADAAGLVRGTQVALLEGPLRRLLEMERTTLNFLQRLSGIATLTARFVAAVEGTAASIFDTRKTTPGWRVLEKYAVRCGGGKNHRLGLFDAVLIKDNHLAGLAATDDPFGVAVAAARAAATLGTTIEVEVDSLAQLELALKCRPDIILLDNLGADALREAVHRRAARAPGILLEASGGVTLESVASLARTGVDRISVGALTHSAPALDLALDFEPAGLP